ncbi:MAG: excinuclease ABC subunit UvrC [Clostridiales bacterium]|nr:excinuclease ABC subunit UvrC [Clostridiales bacterium]
MTVERLQFNIEDELRKLPGKPGVYLMKDKQDRIIYVGKAVNLQNRVKSYFQKGNKPARTVRMVSLIKSFEYIVANDEREAFIIECNLIKSHMPHYNIMLKDDKTYPYIKVTVKDEYPRISITRKFENDGAKYFGPYPERVSAKKAVNILQQNFPIRTCKKKVMGKDKRPCLNYQINRCLGPCANLCTKEQYLEQVDGLVKFLEGKAPGIIEDMKIKMVEASSMQKYEQAAVYRDKINTLRKASDIYMISPGMKRSDVIACSASGGLAAIYILNINEGAVIDRHQFEIDSHEGVSEKELLKDFIRQYYALGNLIPDILLVRDGVENSEWLSEWLSGIRDKKVSIHVPVRGEKKKLAEMAYDNAVHVLSAFRERQNADKTNLMNLAKLLQLEEFPKRIEGYDISNLAGKDTVGSMVVFIDGKPKKSMYRKFSVNSTAAHDDLKAMAEVVGRRIARLNDEKFGQAPDLLMIDGGYNQVNAVLAMLESIDCDIPVCGMVKDDRHITRGLIYEQKEFGLRTDSGLFRFIASIQNEAHRFAIEYNRKKRAKRYFDSQLDNIPGIGEKRKEDLLKHFGSLREIRAAGISQLEAVKGISRNTAKDVYAHFHGKAKA